MGQHPGTGHIDASDLNRLPWIFRKRNQVIVVGRSPNHESVVVFPLPRLWVVYTGPMHVLHFCRAVSDHFRSWNICLTKTLTLPTTRNSGEVNVIFAPPPVDDGTSICRYTVDHQTRKNLPFPTMYTVYCNRKEIISSLINLLTAYGSIR